MNQEKESEPKKKEGVVVHFNNEKFVLPESKTTGADLYQTFGVPSGNKLFLDVKSKNEPDKLIPNDAAEIELKNGDHFYDLPPGTVG
ncbi:MAG: hypothetical protein V3T58_01515 [Candidatus Hydrothermarchaeales archaeon]